MKEIVILYLGNYMFQGEIKRQPPKSLVIKPLVNVHLVEKSPLSVATRHLSPKGGKEKRVARGFSSPPTGDLLIQIHTKFSDSGMKYCQVSGQNISCPEKN